MKRTASIRVIVFCLLAACGALCQMRPSPALLQRSKSDGSHSPEMQRPEFGTWSSLPNAPSTAQPPTQAESFHAFVTEANSSLKFGGVGVGTGVVRETELRHVTPGPQPGLTALYQVSIQKESGASAFLSRHICQPVLKQAPHYYPSTSGSFMGRVSYAASRILITRDGSGKRSLNTSLFLAMLTSSAIHTASRPYWAQSTSATFNDFGSTIGGDAGINVMHEFGPGIRQIVIAHTPKFVSRIEERITQDHTPMDQIRH